MPMMNTARILEAIEVFNGSGFSRSTESDVARTHKVGLLLRLAGDAGTTDAEREAAGREAVRMILLHKLEVCPPGAGVRTEILVSFLTGVAKGFQL